MAATLKLTGWPIADLSVSGPFGEAEMEQLMRELAAMADRQVPYIIVVDARNAAVPGWRRIKILAEGARLHRERLAFCPRGTATISKNLLLRHTITALNCLSAPSAPNRFFANESGAELWAAEQLR